MVLWVPQGSRLALEPWAGLKLANAALSILEVNCTTIKTLDRRLLSAGRLHAARRISALPFNVRGGPVSRRHALIE